MTLANPLRKVASKLMAKFGGVVTINRVTAGVYNPTTGTASESGGRHCGAWCDGRCQCAGGE
jgi:hypothetical protein